MSGGLPVRGGSFRTQLVALTAAVTALAAVVLTIVVPLVVFRHRLGPLFRARDGSEGSPPGR